MRAQAGQALAYLARTRRQYLGLYLGFAIYFLGAYGASVWQVVTVSRQFGMPAARVAAIFGPLAMLFGIVGPMLGGTLVDWSVRRSGNQGLLRLLCVVPLLAIPSTLAVFAASPFIAILLYATQAGISSIVGSCVLAYLQASMPPEMRGFSVSLTGLLNTLLGLAVGPTLVAVLTDRVFADPALVGRGILCVAAPAYVAAALLFFAAMLSNRGTTEVHARV